MTAIAPQANFLLFEPYIITGFPGYYLFTSKVDSTNQYQFSNTTLPDKYTVRGIAVWNSTTVNFSICDWVTSFGAANNNLPTPTQIDTYLQSLYHAAPWQMSSSNPNPILYQVASTVTPGSNIIYKIGDASEGSVINLTSNNQSFIASGNGTFAYTGTLQISASSITFLSLHNATAGSILYYNAGLITQGAPVNGTNLLYQIASTASPGNNVINEISDAGGLNYVSINGSGVVATNGNTITLTSASGMTITGGANINISTTGNIQLQSQTNLQAAVNMTALTNTPSQYVLSYTSGSIGYMQTPNQLSSSVFLTANQTLNSSPQIIPSSTTLTTGTYGYNNATYINLSTGVITLPTVSDYTIGGNVTFTDSAYASGTNAFAIQIYNITTSAVVVSFPKLITTSQQQSFSFAFPMLNPAANDQYEIRVTYSNPSASCTIASGTSTNIYVIRQT